LQQRLLWVTDSTTQE